MEANCVVKVRLNHSEETRRIAVSSIEKPALADNICEKWQNILDIVANCLDIPAALIMKFSVDEIEVFLSSHSQSNPYQPKASDHLGHGLYCETVVGLDQKLVIPNALVDKQWQQNPDIKLGMVSYMGFPIKWPDGEFFGTICVLDSKENHYSGQNIKLLELLKGTIEKDLQDTITNYRRLKSSYNELKKNMNLLKMTKAKLEKSLKEKELLLSEIHHRVKNNLQIISSFIDLQADRITNSQTQNQLNSIRSRILTMGLVHETLYKAKDFARISIKVFVKLLSSILCKLFFSDTKWPEINIYIETNLKINLDTAIPLGLIINEILTNSFKYGIRGIENAKINIEMKKQKNNTYTLNISDNGKGIIPNSLEHSDGLGHQIIEALVEQLNGTMTLTSQNGTSYAISINEVIKEEKRWLKKS